MNYRNLIRHELASNAGKVYREESRAYWTSGSSDAWDEAASYDVDQSEQSFWSNNEDEDDDDMQCMFF